MKHVIQQLNNSIECCFLYIDSIDGSLKELLKRNFLEIVSGKLEAERATDEEYNQSLRDAAKYIYQKKGDTNRVGIIGELLFHSILRVGELAKKYISLGPTIGYSDSYKQFYKGFDGCYYCNDQVWIVEVKSKIKSLNLDIDNKAKVKDASKQIKSEAEDEEINRWENAKKQVRQQLTEIEQEKFDIYKLLRKEYRNKYNQMIGTLLICSNSQFNKDFIIKYCNELFHENVENQKILLICMRSFDFEKIIKYIENEVGNNSG